MEEEYDVLVVDDEQVVIDSIRKVLACEGLSIDECLEAQSALTKIERGRYRIAIVDLMMPKISGTKLLQIIVASYPQLPVILTSGYLTRENAVLVLKLGAFDFLPKPFTFDELTAVVQRALRFASLRNGASDLLPGETGTPMSEIETEVPVGHYRLGRLSWAKPEPNGTVVVGLEDLFQREIGPVENIELPQINDTVQQGSALGKINAKDQLSHIIMAPVSGRVVDLNGFLQAHAELVNEEPYGRGWLVRLQPLDLDNELQGLVSWRGADEPDSVARASP